MVLESTTIATAGVGVGGELCRLAMGLGMEELSKSDKLGPEHNVS